MSEEQFKKSIVSSFISYGGTKTVNDLTMRSFNFHNNPCVRITSVTGNAYIIQYKDESRHRSRFDCFDSYLYIAGFTRKGYEIYIDSTGLFYSFDSQEEIHAFILKFCIEFDERRKKYTASSSTLDIYNPSFGERNSITWNIIGQVSPRKIFDRLFYDQKPQLIELLKKFQSKTMYPSNIPMDNKLGILLYGPPGTGKTGTISAIANMLNLHVCVINFSVIRTCDELDAIMTPKLYEKNMFVFDEIDCILDAITKDGKKTDTSAFETPRDWGSMLMCTEGEERKEILSLIKSERSKKRACIDLAYLLQKLDGLESANGRLIVATTNHPEKINPALLRPGRFDLKLELGNCSKAMYVDIIASFYNNDQKIRQRVAAANLPEFKHSPLTVINQAMREPNLDKLIRLLKR